MNIYDVTNENDEYFNKIHDFYYPPIKDRGDYSFGYRFYYLCQAKYNKEINASDDGGNDEPICDWYIEPKYKSLKEELLQNTICTITSNDYDDVLQKARQHFESNICKTKYKGRHYYYERQVTNSTRYAYQFSVSHIISMMIYCNFTVS